MKPNRQESDAARRRAENALFDAIATLRGTGECGDFLKDLCTPAELQALVDRWQVVNYLQQDLPYRRIHDLTGVSVTTIGRVARFLSDGFGGYQLALERLKRHRSRKSSAAH
ncbi:MAG: YerC/YecD family TrpR-related protein [Woeseia sp.]